MTQFPRAEPDVAALALALTQGLIESAADFPAPPVPPSELEAMLGGYNTALAAIVVAEGALRDRQVAKDKAFEHLSEAMKADFKYAEFAVRDQPEKLSQIGWGSRRNGQALEAPGEVRDIKIRSEGDTWLVLDWDAPVDGGAVAVYKIQRRKRDGGAWEDILTSMATEQIISNQPRAVELEYRVLAMNKAGAGQPSGTVTVVL